MGRLRLSIDQAVRLIAEGRSFPRLLDTKGLDEVRGTLQIIEAAGKAFTAGDYPTVKQHMEEAALLLQSAESRLGG